MEEMKRFSPSISWKLENARDKKTEHLFCPFSGPEQPVPDIYLHEKVLPKCDKFKYLGSKINKNADCEDDVNHCISVGWMKWRENSAIFCDPKIPLRLKGRMHNSVVRPGLSYGAQSWTMYKFLIKESSFINHQPEKSASCFICRVWVHFDSVLAKLVLFVSFPCTFLIPLFLVRNFCFGVFLTSSYFSKVSYDFHIFLFQKFPMISTFFFFLFSFLFSFFFFLFS